MQWSVSTLTDEHLPEVLHDLVVLSLRIAANGTAPDSPARAALELRTTQALSVVNSPAATAFLQQLKGDYEAGQFSSHPPQEVDQPKQRTKLLLDAAVEYAPKASMLPSLAGNAGSPGNTYAKKVAVLRGSLITAISHDDIEAIIHSQVEKAKQGDTVAAKFILERLLGRPRRWIYPWWQLRRELKK